jgi:hypothetical protein
MKQPYSSNITLFKSLFDSKETPYILSIEEIYLRIKEGHGGVKESIEKIRSKPSKDERNSLKKKLKAILFAGEFSQRNDNSLEKHSGLMIADFDDFENEEILIKWRNILINDKYVYMLFRSPSGNGLKAVIRIPASTKEEHSQRHEAYDNYINCDYFDKSNRNVSRVCYESYDEEIYLNQYCEVFEEIEENKGNTYQERPPILVLRNEQDIINRIIKFNFGSSFVEGERNNYIFKVACCFSEYGIDKETCEGWLWNNVCYGNFSQQEMLLTIKSAYKKAIYNSKYFEDSETIKKVKDSITKGITDKEIKKKYDIDEDVINDVKEEISKENEIFWEIEKKKNGKVDVSINEYKYKEFLIQNGYAKFYPENAEKPSFVRVKENKAILISTEQIKDFVLNYLDKTKNIEVWNFCSRATYLFSEKYLNFIDSINLKMLEDDEKTSYIPFKNGVVKVDKNKYELLSYLDVEGYIWEKQIIQRNFKKVDFIKSDFEDFVYKVSACDKDRYLSLKSTLGYLIHSYKNKSSQKAIIFNDQEIDDNPNGGSGKSLMVKAVEQLRKTVKIDGKTFNPTKSDFVYQRVNVDTQILAFDDVKKNFNFENLFSLITEGIAVNRKNKDEIFIPFERSAKIVITTNYVINGAGGSHDRRRHEVEFYQHFSAKHSPKDEYGKYFFDEWQDDEWNNFFNYMISNLQYYLSKGLLDAVSINADEKRLIQSTNKDFYDWVHENNLKINDKNYTTEILEQFRKDYKEYYDLSPRLFLGWVKSYAEHKGYDFIKDKCRETNRRYFVVKTDKFNDINFGIFNKE